MKDLNYFKKIYEGELDNLMDSDEEKPEEEKPEEEKPEEEKPEEKDEEEKDEDIFINMFLDESFIKSFTDNIKQYISENLLDENFNNFILLPYIELYHKDEVYGINVEFDSSVSINLDDDGKVIETDIPNIKSIKYKTPTMEELTDLKNQIGIDSISVFVKSAIKDIKQVPR